MSRPKLIILLNNCSIIPNKEINKNKHHSMLTNRLYSSGHKGAWILLF